ncbi:MAG: hypothetical protein ACI4EV_02815, partial [Lachnospiraceae bacterium]
GPGEMFGVRQSGEFAFRLGDIYADAQLLKDAADAAKEILSTDPDLTRPEHILIAKELEKMTGQMKLR